ncbi:hypothetical protein [Nitratireductor sp. GCM10026969]|uniref:hypothetical protein n=1 Tax=Nitratireductor sp. GCM10026969 TaxID=3252645 RepID=UPI00361D8F57
MRNDIKAIFLGTAAGLLIAGGPVQAQQAQNLTEDEVRSFFDTMQQDVTEAVEAGDFERLVEWTQNRIAEEAVFSVSNEVYRDDERKSFAVVSLDKEDMVRLGHMAAGMLSGMQGQPLQDYSLEIQVRDVTPIGADAASVTAEFTESGTLTMPQHGAPDAAAVDESMQTGATGTEPQQAETGDTAAQQQGRSVRIEANAECNHVVHRGETEDQLVIGLSTCQARTNLQPSSG